MFISGHSMLWSPRPFGLHDTTRWLHPFTVTRRYIWCPLEPLAMATQDSVGSVWSFDRIIISGSQQSVSVWRRRRCGVSSWTIHSITRISWWLWAIRLAQGDLGWRITTSSFLVCGIRCRLHMVEDEMVRIFWSIFSSGHPNLDKYHYCLRQPQAH